MSQTMKMTKHFFTMLTLVSLLTACQQSASTAKPPALTERVIHVAKNGDDNNPGSLKSPLLTISKAAEMAYPGDRIVVHQGVYRESIHPPRGGTSPQKTIHYQAAKNQKVVISGSENIKGWQQVTPTVWKVEIANEWFGDYNPYQTKIKGDWFQDNGRHHHTGAVYLNGHWLWEATELSDLIGDLAKTEQPDSTQKTTFKKRFNVKHLSLGEARTFAVSDKQQITELGDLNFDQDSHFIRIYASADPKTHTGGIAELRLDKPDGKVIAKATITHTEHKDDYKVFTAPVESLTGNHKVYLVYQDFSAQDLANMQQQLDKAKQKLTGKKLWYATVNDTSTHIYAELGHTNPNIEGIEINVRETLFYPKQPYINYITLEGFQFQNAASNWAPPTAEQKAAVGTHWSKGWIIKNNQIRYAKSVCLTLGKYGDEFDNTAADTANGYLDTINRALDNQWNFATIGQHQVINNQISHCEQAGIAGSLGAINSRIAYNKIHDIHTQALFFGYEMAGIKFHAPINSQITDNHIYNSYRGIWLDWMSQGTQVSRNLIHDNQTQDLWLEVNHGPALIDNNILLSEVAVRDWSQGTAFVHNLFAGEIQTKAILSRTTPYHFANSTKLKGISSIKGGDNRYVNNLFYQSTLPDYSHAHPNINAGNLFVQSGIELKRDYSNSEPTLYLSFNSNILTQLNEQQSQLAKPDSWGMIALSGIAFNSPASFPQKVDTDYFKQLRVSQAVFAGPFAQPESGQFKLKH